MILSSTKNGNLKASFEEALFRSLPADNGLYMPDYIPKISSAFIDTIQDRTFNEIAEEVSKTLLGDTIPASDIAKVIERAFDFDAPTVVLDDHTHVLELFHGPSMAFKDFGARFMASIMSYFLEKSQKEIHILVATSGDTGGAVAQGFFNLPNIKVTILYPSGKVSDIQEKQLTTLGHNVTALELSGTFDDCQALVKQAFLDQELNQKFNLASANSINIARLIPQSFYYFRAYAQVKERGLPVVFSVPSGNFGNLSAGVLAQRMGLPVGHFVAATNQNDVVPRYLTSGNYEPLPSVETISNAMDVGSPSNFVRLNRFFGDDLTNIQANVTGYSYTDTQTRNAIQQIAQKYAYVACPHTAVGYLGLKTFQSTQRPGQSVGVCLATAHPAKFLNVVDKAVGYSTPVPPRLKELLDKPKKSISINTHFSTFKAYLLG